MPRNYKHKPKLYTDSSIEKAVSEVLKDDEAVYKTAAKYNMSTSMLRKRVLEKKGELQRKSQVNLQYNRQY